MEARPDSPAGGPGRVAAVVTLALTLAGFVVAALLPMYAESTESTSTDPVTGVEATTTTDTTATLVQVNGPGVLVVLAVPVAVAVLPLLARRVGAFFALRVTTAVLLVAMSVLGGLSVGMLFAPAAVVAVVAAALPGRRAAPAAPSAPTAQPA